LKRNLNNENPRVMIVADLCIEYYWQIVTMHYPYLNSMMEQVQLSRTKCL